MTHEHRIAEPACEHGREATLRDTPLEVLAARALSAKRNGTPGEATDARVDLLAGFIRAGLSAGMVQLLVREGLLS